MTFKYTVPRGHRVAVHMLALTFLATVLTWTVLTPGFRGPDEPQHVNSVVRLAEGGGWPTAGDAYLATSITNSAIEAGMLVPGCYVSLHCLTTLPGGENAWSGAPFLDQSTVDRPDRQTLDEAVYPIPQVITTDQMTQHPPLYYATLATVVKVAGALDWQWDSLLLLLRMVTALMVVPLVYLIHRTTLLLARSPRLALVAAAVPLAVPQLAHIGGVVSNDPLTVLLCATVTYLCVRVMSRDRSWRTLLLLGASLGLAGLTKGTALPFVVLTGLTLLFSARPTVPWGRRVLQTIVVMSTAVASGMWWWFVNILRYGTIQPAGAERFAPEWGDQDPTVGKLVSAMWENITQSFWGEFGWLEAPIASWLPVTLTVIGLILVVLSFGQRSVPRGNLLILLSTPLIMTAILVSGAWENYSITGLFAGLQGRYYFPTLPILVALSAIGARVVVRSAAVRRAVGWVVVAASLTMMIYGLVTAFDAFYVTDGSSASDGVARLLAWAPVSATWVAVLFSSVALFTLLALGLTCAALAQPAMTSVGDGARSPRTVRERVVEASRSLPRPTRPSGQVVLAWARSMAPLAVLAVVGPLAFSAASPPFSTHAESAQIDYAVQLWGGTLPTTALGVTIPPELGSLPVTQTAATQPPLFFALISPVVGPLFNAGHPQVAAYAARAVVLVLAVCVVLATAWAVRQAAPDRQRLAAVAGLVAGLAVWLVHQAGTVDNAILGLMITALGLGLVARTVHRGRQPWTVPALAACLTAAGLTQASALVVLVSALVGLVVYEACTRRGSARSWWTLLWVPLMTSAVLTSWFYLRSALLTAGTTPGPRPVSAAWTAATSDWFWSGALQQFVGTGELRPWLDVILVLPATVGVAALVLRRRPGNRPGTSATLAISCGVLLVGGAWTAATVAPGPGAGPALLVVLPVLAGLVALGLTWLPRWTIPLVSAWCALRVVDLVLDLRDTIRATPLTTAHPTMAWGFLALLVLATATSVWRLRKVTAERRQAVVGEAQTDQPAVASLAERD